MPLHSPTYFQRKELQNNICKSPRVSGDLCYYRRMKVRIQPLSVNKAWRGGRRFKTNDYLVYQRVLLNSLPRDYKVPEGHLSLKVTFGMSNKQSDVDNPVKPFLDTLQEAYDFNDRDVYHLEVTKQIVRKGEEFIEWELSTCDARHNATSRIQ